MARAIAGGRPTVKDVAVAAGVSATTVSRVLAGNYPVSASTRKRVLRAVQDLDFVINAQARALVGGSTRTVAFIVRDLVGPLFAYIGQGVEQQATAEGRVCLVCTHHGDADRELELIELMREQQAEAVVLVGGGLRTPEHLERMAQIARSLERVGSRLVLCGRPPIGPDAPSTVVEYDNEGGAFAVTNYLISLGHRRIAFVGAAEPNHTTTSARFEGYTRAHRAHGLTVDDSLVVGGTFDRESGYRQTKALLARDTGTEPAMTAILGITDMVASGILAALREAGLRVPEDISVAGYDDIPLSADLSPALTTVHIPHEELGRAAVRLALHRDEYALDQHLLLGTHVVIRDSAAPPRENNAR
ncbi:LacI family transcriptional regulator [Kribbella aluminosa]|uniref:LacI family transcriptional regulator n=1 Tax=Kribbella aluminosa TaxID=416017 RepID=A0ABS4UW07_9ACTN|nr:LacI family DNA-binding transcriptional regulator [Kribbella aluminosa]MBP2355822.1 LacI family transcriptional regulator [Kribbella aluminosa]